ncbi:hypothetical protein R3W88_031939 [Solanum pinnatisectum]|uniref:DUF4371 domain-containing protein n=1 Tax=Solanum pinnatisectum TaxID=50273 RepID=A0AAV9LP47_9SOLN|nr:hypothetical protein R3W88_031939 [Solanum pinnatisectum]
MSFIIRSVDISATPINVTKYFLEFLKVDDTSGKGLFEVILDETKCIGLDIDNLRGQGYDNGSNMKGKHQGVQKRLLDINPRSFYTPCESFRVDYFLYIVDQAIFLLQNRFEQFENNVNNSRNSRLSQKKFFKIKNNKILFKINNVSRKIKWFGYIID